MVNLGGFNAADHQSDNNYEVIPEGKYLAIIKSTEMKVTSKGTGEYLQVEYEMLDQKYKGRKLWSRHNLKNPNKLAMTIAKKELSLICQAVGVLTPQDSAELHGIPLMLKVSVRQREDTGDDVNEIKGWYGKKNSSLQETWDKVKDHPPKKDDEEADSESPATSTPGTPPWKR